MSPERRSALLSISSSRRNKMALLATYVADGERVNWRWKAEPYESRLLVSIDGGPFTQCRSYDEDVRPFLLDR